MDEVFGLRLYAPSALDDFVFGAHCLFCQNGMIFDGQWEHGVATEGAWYLPDGSSVEGKWDKYVDMEVLWRA